MIPRRVLLPIFFSLTLVESNTCKLPCRNNGVCNERKDLVGSKASFCQCTAGYAGALCEIKYVLCENAGQVCRNGRTCQRAVDDFEREYFHCECDAKESDFSFEYADKLCAHASTVFCKDTESPERAKKDRKSLGAGGSFCTNGGVCRTEVDDGKKHHFSGCDCPPGYSGPHCESSLQMKKPTKNTVELQTSSRSWLRSFVLFLILTTGLMLGALAFMIHHGNKGRARNRQRRTTREQAGVQEYHDVPEIEVT